MALKRGRIPTQTQPSRPVSMHKTELKGNMSVRWCKSTTKTGAKYDIRRITYYFIPAQNINNLMANLRHNSLFICATKLVTYAQINGRMSTDSWSNINNTYLPPQPETVSM
jgi:arabinogalactan endo-1,4-beta-galactosidase